MRLSCDGLNLSHTLDVNLYLHCQEDYVLFIADFVGGGGGVQICSMPPIEQLGIHFSFSRGRDYLIYHLKQCACSNISLRNSHFLEWGTCKSMENVVNNWFKLCKLDSQVYIRFTIFIVWQQHLSRIMWNCYSWQWHVSEYIVLPSDIDSYKHRWLYCTEMLGNIPQICHTIVHLFLCQ